MHKIIINYKTLLKWAISLSLISILVINTNISEMINSIYYANYYWLALAFIFLLGQFPLTAIKWKKSLNINGLDYDFWYLLIVCCVGFFYNNFLPTNIGGDGYRILKTIPDTGEKKYAISSVLYERIVGLFSLLLLGYIGSFIILYYGDNAIAKIYICIGSLCAALSFAFLLFVKLTNFTSFNKFSYLVDPFRLIKNSGTKNITLFGYSILFQVTAVLSFYFIFMAFGHSISFAKCAVIVAISSLSSLIPLSINGIGVLEGSIVIVSIGMSIDREIALAVSIALRFLLIPISLFSGLFCFINSNKFK